MALRTRARVACLASLMVPVMLLAYNLLSGLAHVSAAVPAPATGIIDILGPQSASGPVDTLVTLEVREYASDAPTYVLAATTTSPEQGGCTTAKRLSGVPPFQLSPARAPDLQFHWPAGPGRGRYWFCASPVSGTGPTAISLASQPFTVLTDTAPTVKITPAGSIRAGTMVTLTISNWLTSDAAPPFDVRLLPQSGSVQTMSPVAAQVSQGQSSPTTGAYVMTVTLPSIVRLETYVLVARGECGPDPLGTSKAADAVCAVSEQSPPFAFAVLTTPFAGRFPTDPVPSRTPPKPDALFLVTVASDILLLMLGLTLALTRRVHTTNTLRR